MFYKVSDTESNIYNFLKNIRTHEIDTEKKNRKLLEELLGFRITLFLGEPKQESYDRVTRYTGFLFPPDVVPNPAVWKRAFENENYFIPNNRTPEGRKMSNILANTERSIPYSDILTIIGVAHPYIKNTMKPKVFLCNNCILISLDDRHIPEDPDLHIITEKDFHYLLKEYGLEEPSFE